MALAFYQLASATVDWVMWIALSDQHIFSTLAGKIVFAREDTSAPFLTSNQLMLSALLPHLRSDARAPRQDPGRPGPPCHRRTAHCRPAHRALRRQRTSHESARPATQPQRQRNHVPSILDEVRNEHACAYLPSTAFSDGEISFLLGYEDPNSFYRAFRSWNGISPGEYRQT